MSEEAPQEEEEEIDPRHLVLIVTGSHLRAEEKDRPLGYALQQRIRDWQKRLRGALNVELTPLVCSDFWYLNHEDLHRRPTISIGGPGVNALSAYFAQQLPTPKPDEQQIVIQIDPEFTDLRVCIWGTDHELTVKGVDLFVDRYFGGFLRAAATQVEPQE
jgi:hypothetical protein